MTVWNEFVCKIAQKSPSSSNRFKDLTTITSYVDYLKDTCQIPQVVKSEKKYGN